MYENRMSCSGCQRYSFSIEDRSIGFRLWQGHVNSIFCDSCDIKRIEEKNRTLYKLKNVQNQLKKFQQSTNQLRQIIHNQELQIKQLQQLKPNLQKIECLKQDLDEGLKQGLQQFKVSNAAIEILMNQGLANHEDLSDLSKEDLSKIGIKMKDALAIKRMFK